MEEEFKILELSFSLSYVTKTVKTYIFSISGLLISYFSMHLFTVSMSHTLLSMGQQQYGNGHMHSKIVTHHIYFMA